jgi:hypothetical protein
MLGSCNVLLNCVVMYYVKLHPGLSFQMTIGRNGVRCSCILMVPCICGTLGFLFMYFHLFFVYCVITVVNAVLMFCCLFVISCDNFVKLFCDMNSSILLL